ncbi:MAG: lysophospholipase [Bacteroidales bacterium]|jgi:alpha-beta hydrolase superfamily lysophospholipase|nr:lysophospholipase [Bacteroidales bacterium]
MPIDNTNLVTSDNLNLHVYKWSETDCNRGVIAIVHGIGEHGFRYDHVAKYFVKAGYIVYAFDYRGHGRSSGKRGFVNCYNELLDDVDLFIDHIKIDNPQSKIVLYGHSLGGNIVTRYTLERHNRHNSMIVTSPWFGLANEIPGVIILLLKMLCKVDRNMIIRSFLNIKHLSHDRVEVEKYKNDKLVHNKVSLNLLLGGIESAKLIMNSAGKIKMPVLLTHGDSDKITSAACSKKFADKSEENLTFKEWPGMYHELHNESEKETVLCYIKNWIESVDA